MNCARCSVETLPEILALIVLNKRLKGGIFRCDGARRCARHHAGAQSAQERPTIKLLAKPHAAVPFSDHVMPRTEVKGNTGSRDRDVQAVGRGFCQQKARANRARVWRLRTRTD